MTMQDMTFKYSIMELEQGGEFQGNIIPLLKATNPTMDEMSL